MPRATSGRSASRCTRTSSPPSTRSCSTSATASATRCSTPARSSTGRRARAAHELARDGAQHGRVGPGRLGAAARRADAQVPQPAGRAGAVRAAGAVAPHRARLSQAAFPRPGGDRTRSATSGRRVAGDERSSRGQATPYQARPIAAKSGCRTTGGGRAPARPPVRLIQSVA